MNRRLYRCRHDRRLAGVAGGLAEYFELDPTLVRILFVLSIFFGGLGLLVYVGMAFIVPLEPVSPDDPEATPAAIEGHRHARHGDGRWTTIVGVVLILFGALALVDRYLPMVDVKHVLVPAIMIGIGAVLLVGAFRRESMET